MGKDFQAGWDFDEHTGIKERLYLNCYTPVNIDKWFNRIQLKLEIKILCMRYNGYYEELDKESVVDTVCDFIKEDVEQKVLEMIGKLPQDILNRIKISKSDITVEKSDVEEYIESYLEPSEPEYDYHEKDYDYGITGEMDVLDCIFK